VNASPTAFAAASLDLTARIVPALSPADPECFIEQVAGGV
jgi:hypothetical protein